METSNSGNTLISIKREIISHNQIGIQIDCPDFLKHANFIRSEGSREMRLQNDTLTLESEGIGKGNIHPDILALISILTFHPILEKAGNVDLYFNFDITERVQQAVARKWILPDTKIKTISQDILPYTPKTDSVISYGGGLDSLAAHCLLPNLKLVHETPSGKNYSDSVCETVKQLSAPYRIVHTNLRQIYSLWGLPLWVSVFISSLLEQPKYIISGSELTGTYLLGGQKYYPRNKNLWYLVFRTIGVEILPTSFLSEIGNAIIVTKSKLTEKAAYCATISKKHCMECTKCLRRALILSSCSNQYTNLVSNFNLSPETLSFLKKRPLYYGDIFTQSAKRILAKNAPNPPRSDTEQTILSTLEDLTNSHPNLSFLEKFYSQTFEDFEYPQHIKNTVELALSEYGIQPMQPDDICNMTNYCQ